ncbi:MAG: DUF58 domain-containing protein [Armatimonadota bacterium]
MVLPVPWLLLAGLAFALGWVTATPVFYWLGYLMVAVWLIAVASGRLAQRGLKAVRKLSADRVANGGEVAVEVTVSNTAALPVPWLVAAESLPAGLPMTGLRGRVGPLAANRSFSFRYTLHAARRGYYQLGPTVLRTGDLFGLSQRERSGAGVEALTVYPVVLPITHARLPSRRPAGDVRGRRRALEDPAQVVGIRPYQHGDELRRVHWRATAHTGRLQSKLFELSAQVEIILVLDLRRADYPDSPNDAAEAAELAVTATASIANHTLEGKHRVGLLALGRDPAAPPDQTTVAVRPGRDREQLTAILSVLGRIQLGFAEPLAPALEREKEQWNWGALVILITPRLTAEELRTALGLRSSGFDVQAVLAGRNAGDSAGLEPLGITAAAVRSEADINGLGL